MSAIGTGLAHPSMRSGRWNMCVSTFPPDCSQRPASHRCSWVPNTKFLRDEVRFDQSGFHKTRDPPTGLS